MGTLGAFLTLDGLRYTLLEQLTYTSSSEKKKAQSRKSFGVRPALDNKPFKPKFIIMTFPIYTLCDIKRLKAETY